MERTEVSNDELKPWYRKKNAQLGSLALVLALAFPTVTCGAAHIGEIAQQDLVDCGLSPSHSVGLECITINPNGEGDWLERYTYKFGVSPEGLSGQVVVEQVDPRHNGANGNAWSRETCLLTEYTLFRSCD